MGSWRASTTASKASSSEVANAVAVAAGRTPGTLLLRGARVLNLFTLEINEVDVLLAGRLIAAVGADLERATPNGHGIAAEEVVDLGGAYLAPGLIDGHLHLESSLVTPANYALAVLPRGVTGVVCDPHEIANVLGEQGVQWLLDATDNLPLDVYVTVPSCVPSTLLETAGAELGLDAMERLQQHPRVVGVAEVMSFPAVVGGDQRVLAKVELADAAGLVAEGHAPGLTGRELQAYVASGISSDHESTTYAEGLEKLRAGLFLMVREGSLARDLGAHLALLESRRAERIGFVTDDKFPHDLLAEGGVDHLVRQAVAGGVDPLYAVRCASLNNALHYRLPRRGAVAPGYFADLVVLDDLASFSATAVYKDGRAVVPEALAARPTAEPAGDELVRNTVRLPPLDERAFKIEGPPITSQGAPRARCVGVVEGQIVTTALEVTPLLVNGEVVADVEHDLLKLACVERHGRTRPARSDGGGRGGGIGVGLVKGFGLQRGALASSVGHDHHNLMVVGANDDDMMAACRRLAELGGGFVVVEAGEVRAELPLPLAGLLTDAPLEVAAQGLERLEAAARELGCRLASPFMALSFMGLPVIPELKVTDHGLVDVSAGAVVETLL